MTLLLVAASAGASAPATDVMFVFDTSGSMGPVLEQAKSEMNQVMVHLSASLPNVDFGVAEVRDYGESAYDSGPDQPWTLDQALSPDEANVAEAISSLEAGGGGDGPEAYGRALWETDTNPNVGWRPGARHLIVLVADQVPHDPNVNEGIPEEDWLEPSPWNTGEELPGDWGIPGTQLKAGQTLDFQSVLSQLAADGKPLEMVDYHDTEGDFIHYWEYWASLAGGHALEAEAEESLSGELESLIENAPEDTVCASSVLAAPGSPTSPGGLPTAVTARFLQPGSQVVLAPGAGKEFCAGQYPDLGGSVVYNLEEATPGRMLFRVPPTAASGLSITNLSGGTGPQQPFEVDNFRYPWGFSMLNSAGDGARPTYDAHIAVQPQDVESVFKEVGPPGSEVYEYVKGEMKQLLGGGLCYGFSLLSRSLYDDAHAGHDALAFAGSSGFGLHSGETAYPLGETNTGSHAVTHALLRAAASQFSPEARLAWHAVSSVSGTEAQLNQAFQHGHPALLLLHFVLHGLAEGHAVLAFDYEKSGGALLIDVADPNVPWSPGQPPSDYERLRVVVNANGSWDYGGSFSGTFADAISGAAGSLSVVPEPRSPGGLTVWYNPAAPADTAVSAAGGLAGLSIGYSSSPANGLPGDVRESEVFDDGPSDQLLIPAVHRTITLVEHAAVAPGEKTYVAGKDFLDVVQGVSHSLRETVHTATGTMSVPVAGGGEQLSVTNIAHGMQQTVTARFRGRVLHPTLSVNGGGEVTLTSAGGAGVATVQLATYLDRGGRALTHPQRIALRGHVRVRRHTPKVKHRRSKRRKRRR